MQAMPSVFPIEINQPQSVENYIKDLLEELDIQDQYYTYSLTIPRSFRVRFAPASSLITYGVGSHGEPIDLTGDD
jgi:hypothetical protein